MKKDDKIHPLVYKFKDEVEKGKCSRREFIRYATLLGVSSTAASQMLLWGCGDKKEEAAETKAPSGEVQTAGETGSQKKAAY